MGLTGANQDWPEHVADPRCHGLDNLRNERLQLEWPRRITSQAKLSVNEKSNSLWYMKAMLC